MNRKPLILLAAIALTVPARAQLEVDALLRAIALVESANHNEAIGKAGERSAWQLTEAVWKQYTPWRFEVASRNPVLAHRVAKRHLLTIIRTLKARGREVSVLTVARVWNPYAPADYAERMQNLYEVEVANRGNAP